MDYEEKYNDLLSRIKRMADVQPDVTRVAIESLFPELKESEDERIRKKLIDYFKDFLEGNEDTYKVGGGVTWEGLDVKDVIAWLEKKGEQSPAWSEEDEENLNWFEKFFRAESVVAEGKDIPQDRYLWFKNLKDRVQPQPKQEWSEEDEKNINLCIKVIKAIKEGKVILKGSDGSEDELISWFKSLKDRYTWKPSDEQIRRLEYFLKLWGKTEDTENTKVFETVKSLLNDLKKLREE